jgi:hypothetical protein
MLAARRLTGGSTPGRSGNFDAAGLVALAGGLRDTGLVIAAIAVAGAISSIILPAVRNVTAVNA